MNKIGKIIVLIVILAIGGYFIYNQLNNKNNYESIIKKYSEDYFTKYISINESQSTYKITLNDLENSSENYDLKSLNKCDKEKTYANVTVDFKTGNPKKVEVQLKC